MPDAAERKVLIVTTFVSACIAFAPMEWTSAITLLVVSGLMLWNDRRLTARENAAEAAAKAAIAAAPIAPDADDSAADEPASLGEDSAPHANPAAAPARL